MAKRTTTPTEEEQTKRRAEYVMDLLTQGALSYDDKIAACMRTFACGKTAAEHAHALAKQMMHDRFVEYSRVALQEMCKSSIEDEATARARGDVRAADKIRDTRARWLGIGAPQRLELSGKVEVGAPSKLAPLTEDQLAALALIDTPKPGDGESE